MNLGREDEQIMALSRQSYCERQANRSGWEVFDASSNEVERKEWKAAMGKLLLPPLMGMG